MDSSVCSKYRSAFLVVVVVAQVNSILMLASENGEFKGAKVGGVADVIKELPNALSKKGVKTDSVIPSYGFLIRQLRPVLVGSVEVLFEGETSTAEVYRHRIENSTSDVYIIDHKKFYEFGEAVYYHDSDSRPFAKDATKYAFWGACIAEALLNELIPSPDVIHCHDWHACFFLILINSNRRYQKIKNLKSVLTIHNMAMQGIRPFKDDKSSLTHWFPDLKFDHDLLVDPRYNDCVNPLKAGILVSNKVHAVSPSYAEEIQIANKESESFFGGEGLEAYTGQRSKTGDLVGILNGCEYNNVLTKPYTKQQLSTEIVRAVKKSANDGDDASNFRHTLQVTDNWMRSENGITLTSVSRLTSQKFLLLMAKVGPRYVLEEVLDYLGPNGYYIILGSGDPLIESIISEISLKYHNLIFINGYNETLANQLYASGDLFLMPSSFEPCGISQMLAMRHGQLCLVNAVGGLKDTVKHLATGFVFSGSGIKAQVRSMQENLAIAVDLFYNDRDIWERLQNEAKAQRFTWDVAAGQMIDSLYI